MHGRGRSVCRLRLTAAIFVGACLLFHEANAAPSEPSPEADLTPAARQAIQKGIEYLVKNQDADGRWRSHGPVGRYPTALTALAGLALLQDGNLPSSGRHADSVRRAVNYLLTCADPETGLIGGEESGRPMFGHGYAMLFLAQVYGSEGHVDVRSRIEEVLTNAVALTVGTQSEHGGWYYTPTPKQDEGAVTITQMQALRACANAGIEVPAKTVRAAMKYIEDSANEDGGIAYRAKEPGESRPAITCAAIATLYNAGLYDTDLARNALDYATDHMPTTGVVKEGGGHFFYGHLYLSQVMYFQGDTQWQEYFPKVRDWLVANQSADGSWDGDYIGTVYGTSVALMILQLPYNTLPIAQR